MVDLVPKGEVEEIFVAHKDRLYRFAVELSYWLCSREYTKLVVQDQVIRNSEQELTKYIVAIIHVFSCRLNGKRRYLKKKEGGK